MLRPACEILERMADWGHFASVVPSLADALYEQGRGHEAERWIDLAARWTLEDDLDAQIGWRRVRARLLARRGDFDAAERLAHDAINLALKTDYLENRASAFTDLAEVLRLAGRTSEAAAFPPGGDRSLRPKGQRRRRPETAPPARCDVDQ
jgi:tetratricopeptide (TPR) repeat protein